MVFPARYRQSENFLSGFINFQYDKLVKMRQSIGTLGFVAVMGVMFCFIPFESFRIRTTISIYKPGLVVTFFLEPTFVKALRQEKSPSELNTLFR